MMDVTWKDYGKSIAIPPDIARKLRHWNKGFVPHVYYRKKIADLMLEIRRLKRMAPPAPRK